MNWQQLASLRVTNSKILNFYVFAIAAIPSILATFLIEQSRNPNSLAINLLIFSATSYFAFIFMVIMYYLTYLKPKINSDSSLMSIALVGVIFGAAKGLLNYYLIEFGEQASSLENSLGQRIFSGASIGLITLLGISLANYEFDRLRKLREERIKWLVDAEVLTAKESELFEQLADSVRNKFSSDFAAKLVPVVTKIEFRNSEINQIDKMLRELETVNRNQVKIVADEIQTLLESQYPPISAKELFKAIFGGRLFSISLIVPILVLTSISFVYTMYPANQLLPRLFEIGASAALIFWLANKIQYIFKENRFLLWVIAVILAGFTPYAINHIFFQENILLMIPVMVTSILWIATISIFTNLGVNFFTNRQILEAQLGAELDQSLIKEQTIRNLNRDLLFEISKFLHGTIQTQVTTTGISVSQALKNQDFKLVAKITEHLNDLAKNPLKEFTITNNQDMTIQISELINKWNGLLEIKFDLEDLKHFSSYQLINLLKVLEEASLNSYRHGKADQLNVMVENKVDHIKVTFVDNGIGLVSKNRGFGSLIFDEVAQNWTLSSNQQEAGTVLTLTLR